MKLGLENIKSCLIRDEHKVRIYKECFLPSNRFILLIHDLTKMDLKKLDDLMHGYLKSWLGMPKSGSFLPVHSGLCMDVKSVSHFYKESRSVDIVREHCSDYSASQGSVSARVGQELCRFCGLYTIEVGDVFLRW
jgi:hypothetical protein